MCTHTYTYKIHYTPYNKPQFRTITICYPIVKYSMVQCLMANEFYIMLCYSGNDNDSSYSLFENMYRINFIFIFE